MVMVSLPDLTPVADGPSKNGTRGETSEPYMFRGNLHRTGVYNSTVPDNNTLLWSFDTGIYSIDSSPVVVENKVFFGCNDRKIYCVDILTGKQIWNYETGNAVRSTPTVVDGVVYVGSTDYNLYAFDADSGQKLWNYSLGIISDIWSSPAFANDMVFFGSDNGYLYALNVSNKITPKLEWKFPTGNKIQSSPAVDWPYVYVGSVDGKLYCIWASNGTQRWAFEPEDVFEIYATPIIANGSIYIGTAGYEIGGALYHLDAGTGEEIWRFLPPGDGRFSEVYSSAAVHNGTVFIHAWYRVPGPGDRGTIYAIPEMDPNGDGNITHDEIIWSFITWDDEGGSSPAVADEKVLVGSTHGKLYCLNISNGQEIWNLTTGGVIIASPTIADGVVYITSYDGTLYAIGDAGPAKLEIEVIPESPSVKSERVMGISFLVTYRGYPVEGAFINFDVSSGQLSQSGASTFGDGSQRIKYTAPSVSENTTITVYASATKYGYPEAQSSAQFVVEPATSYEKTSSSTSFSWTRYWNYIIIICVLLVLNIVIILYNLRRKQIHKETPNNDTKGAEK
jgi:outer membrane protein assembly factor BamB